MYFSAWLPFGGWNDCPDTHELMAAAKYWAERHGAVPAAMSHDELEFVLAKPVRGEEAGIIRSRRKKGCPPTTRT